MPSTPLNGATIWLTRPEGQGADLRSALERLGAQVKFLPLLVIRPITPSQADRQKLIDLDRYDLVFFVSTNAATIGLDAIAQWWPQYPVGMQTFAVGPGTAAVLEKHGIAASYPTERMSSEALLALPELLHIAGKRALIVRGAGGREIIAEGLRERGATVDYAELYERALPSYDTAALQELLRNAAPTTVMISSAEALTNLKALFTPVVENWARLPLVVSSPRLGEHAKSLGFQYIDVIEGATDAAIIQGLTSLAGKEFPHERAFHAN
jgi:uroporphyrinogen-III synthase